MAERSDSSDEVARALAAFVRAEFQAPVAGLCGLVEIVAEDAAAAGLSAYDSDLAKMRAAGARLLGLVSALLDVQADTVGTRPADALRHDLRTPVTAIIGYGELLAEDAREQGDTVLFRPLADALEAAGRLLRELDKLVAFAVGGGSTAAAGGGNQAPTSSVLVAGAEVARRLSRYEPQPSRSSTGRILVVDDNDSMRDLLARRLTRDGHDVSVCSSGQTALDMSGSGAFDLMLLDLMMPGMNGLEVLDRLRARPTTGTLPVIVVSALDELDMTVRCIEAGADDFLSKPVNETLLRARIASSLERKFLRDREQDALKQLERERERSETLLSNVLPQAVVDRLRGGETVGADQFDAVSVLFCDLVGFTPLTARISPAETIDLLNAIFSAFDDLAEQNGLEKIKTVGDAYMVVGGMSDADSDHAVRTVRMACGMPAVAARHGLSVRIGIDTGPAIGGIIGRRKFFYDVWGDTVNTASRLEAAAEPGRIHVSATTRDALGDAFPCEPLAPMVLKGKGLLQTYFVAPTEG